MTRKRAERLPGYEIRELLSYRDLNSLAAFNDGAIVAKASGKSSGSPLKSLADRIYQTHCAVVLKQQRGCCARYRCGRPVHITATTAPTAALIVWRTSSPFVGIATG